MRTLIFGGAGFIGRHVARCVAAGGSEVTVCDLVAPRVAEEGIAYARADVRQPLRLFQLMTEARPEVVIHLAAHGAGGEGLTKAAEADPLAAVDVNIHGFLNVLEVARLCGVRRVVWSSSTAVLAPVGRYGSAPVDEQALISPGTLYGASKAFAEQLAREYRRAFDMELVGLRPSLVYGPGLWYSGAAAAISRLFEAAATGGRCQIQDPGEEWDLIYVKDVAEILVRLATISAPADDLIAVTGHRVSLPTLVEAVRTHVPDLSVELTPGGPKLGLPFLDVSRSRHYGLEARYDLDAAVRDYLGELQKGDN